MTCVLFSTEGGGVQKSRMCESPCETCQGCGKDSKHRHTSAMTLAVVGYLAASMFTRKASELPDPVPEGGQVDSI